jgi:SRSO17 transposase
MKGRRTHGTPDKATERVLASAPPELEGLCARVEGRFKRVEARGRFRRYLGALLAPLPRKNGWQIAEPAGDRSPDGVQELLNAAVWDADGVRDDLRDYVVEHLGDPEGVLVVDETGFVKKGRHSVGVARQYSGTAGKVENCQVGVFLTYATEAGRTFLDRELYLPKEWASDRDRRCAAGVPEAVEFATKPQLAQRMLARALDAGVPAAWVTGDAVYGRDARLRRALEERRQPYVLGVGPDEEVCPECEWLPPRTQRADALAAQWPPEAWERHSCGAGAKGPRLYDWAWMPLFYREQRGWGRFLLIRRSLTDPSQLAYYRVFGPETTTFAEVVRAAGARWSVEESFESGKGLVGLDQYEVRRWEAWYRYITLAALAHAFLTIVRARAMTPPATTEPRKGGSQSPRSHACRDGHRSLAPTPHRARGASLAVPARLPPGAVAAAHPARVAVAAAAPGQSPALSLSPPPRTP